MNSRGKVGGTAMDLWSLANFPVLFIEVIRCCVHAMALVAQSSAFG